MFLLTASETFAADPPSAAGTAASVIKKGLTETNAVAGLDQTPLPALIGKLIQALLGVVGIVFLVYTVYGGILYMTAGGDDTKVLKAKKMIMTSVIGVIIIVAAYSLTSFVITTITNATAGGTANPND